MKQQTIKEKAQLSCGQSRTCGKCKYSPCSQSMFDVCSRSFMEGYQKGYKQHRKEVRK